MHRPVIEDLEILNDFIKDSRELIETAEQDIIVVQSQMADGVVETELINKIFRTFHSLKGGADFLGLRYIKEIAHTAENVLDLIRSDKIDVNSESIYLFVISADFIKNALEVVAADQTDAGLEPEYDMVKESLSEFLEVIRTIESLLENPLADFAPQQSDDGSPMAINGEFVAQFISEGLELLKNLEDKLLVWQNQPDDKELLREIFRLIHTFKGNCGIIGYPQMGNISHTMESVIDALQSGARFSLQIPRTFVQMADVLRAALIEVGQTGCENIAAADLYIDLLHEFIPKGFELKEQPKPVYQQRVGDILRQQGVVDDEALSKAIELQSRPIGEILVDIGAAKKEEVEQALKIQKKLDVVMEQKPLEKTVAVVKQDMRVDVSKLDMLNDLIGELVIANNMIIQNPEFTVAGKQYKTLPKAAQHLGKIVREIHEVSMMIRMTPVSPLFKRMMRLVYDLTSKSGKKIDLVIKGEDTEVDKTVIEIITDPLVHIIRNALDHGMETPEERKKVGKPEKGVIHLSAVHREDEIHIIVEDDGRGINRQKVLQKAIERGLVEGDGSHLSDKEIVKLIFEPGFSTAEKVTEISGRGVGMDVVRKNLDKVKGVIDVDSVEGRGTHLTLKIPLTLAIIDGMLVEVGGSFFTIPLQNIRELFRPRSERVVISPDGSESIRVREEIVPVVRLYDSFDINPSSFELGGGMIVIVEARGKHVGLFVDRVVGQQQTVVKPMPPAMNDIQGVSGCNILGNGRISMILDVEKIALRQ